VILAKHSSSGSARTYLDPYFDARAEPVDYRDEAVDGEPSEVCIADARKVGCGSSRAVVGSAYAQSLPIKRLYE